MAIVNVSLDTQSRQMALTINGVIVPMNGCYIEKYTQHDGEVRISFSYTVENVDGNGLKETRQFFLPSPEDLAVEAHTGLNKDGLASKIVHDDEKAKADVIAYLQDSRK